MLYVLLKYLINGNSLAVLWLGLGTFTAVGLGLIPGRGTKIPQPKTLPSKIQLIHL